MGPIARAVLDPADVAASVGAPTARDAEPRLLEGAWGSLFHAYRVDEAAPHPPSLVRVFPYADPAWKPVIDGVLDVEVAAWRAWWRWVRDGLGADADGLYPIPPEVRDLGVAVRRVVVKVGDAEYPAMIRPMLAWPDLGHAGLPDERVPPLWDALAVVIRERIAPSVKADTGKVLEVPAFSAFPEARRRLLTDGRFVVPSNWRGFEGTGRGLDEKRGRTRA
jgi:hypothetical protein